MTDRTKRNSHPGYAIKASDGTWVSSAHGLFLAVDPFYGLIFKAKETAQREIEIGLRDEDLPNDLTYEVVEAWEPLCEKLRFDVEELQRANKISPSDLMDMSFELESILSKINIWKDENKED